MQVCTKSLDDCWVPRDIIDMLEERNIIARPKALQ